MFKPATGRISRETCDLETGWTLDTGQYLDGTLRLAPTTTTVKSKEIILPNLGTPDYATDIPRASLWADFQASTRGTNWLGSSVYMLSYYDNGATYTVRSTEGSITSNVALKPSATIPSTIDNATGWTIDTRCVSWSGRARIIITDGTYRLEFCAGPEGLFRADGVTRPWEHPERALVPLSSWAYYGGYAITVTEGVTYGISAINPFKFPEPITLRISLQGTSLRIKTEEHDVVYDNYPGCQAYATSNKGLYYQMLNEWHLDRKNYAGIFIISDIDFWANPFLNRTNEQISATTSYPTVTQTAYSPAFAPGNVKKFVSAVYDVQNTTGDGTLTVTPQYRYTASSWNDGTPLGLSSAQIQQSLGYVGYQELRFKVQQVSTTGIGDSPRLDKITVACIEEDEGVYRIRPGYGQEQGGNTVAFDIVASPTNPYYSTGDYIFVEPDASGAIDAVADATITEGGEVRNNASFIGLGGVTGEVDLTSYGFMAAQADGAGFCSGVSALNGASGYVENRNNPGTYTVDPMQKVDATNGQGITFDTITGLIAGYHYIVQFPLWVLYGGVNISSENGLFAQLRPDRSRLMRVGFTATGASMTLTFTAIKASQFYVGKPRLFKCYSGNLDCGVQSNLNNSLKYVLDAKFFLHGYPNDYTPIMSNSPDNDTTTGFDFGVDGNGSPYLTVGSATFTGDYIFPLHRWQSIQAKVDTSASAARLFANGEYVGKMDLSGETTDPGTGNLYIGHHPADDAQFFPGAVYRARATSEYMSDFDVSYRLARRTSPKFQSSYEPELDANTLVYLMFNQSQGLIQNQGSLEHPIIPYLNRPYVLRGVTGVHSQGIRFTRQSESRFGTMYIEDDMAWVNESFLLEGYVRTATRYNDQTIMAVGSTGEYGFQVQVDTNGVLMYHFSGDAGEVTIRSDQVAAWKIASGGYQFWHWAVAHDRSTDGIAMWIEGTHVAGQTSGSLGSVSGQTKLYIGSEGGTGDALSADLDEVRVWTGDLSGASLSWPPSASKWTPSQAVYVDGVQLNAARVTHYSPERKLVVMPSHSPGNVDTKVVGSTYYGIDQYKYVQNYHIVLDTGDIESKFGTTRSPFRILSRVPDHGVPIALLGTQLLSVDTHMSKTELSDREPANRTGFGSDVSVLRNGVTGNYVYADAVDTDEILVSNRSAQWKDLNSPRPLFFKYLVGRRRYYVSVPSAQDSDDIVSIRQAIRLVSNTGTDLDIIWDIVVSDYDYFGDTLPEGVYSVVLLLETIPTSTVWVEYQAADTVERFQEIGVRKEIVNPVPLFGKHSGRMGISLDSNAVGSYNVTVTP